MMRKYGGSWPVKPNYEQTDLSADAEPEELECGVIGYGVDLPDDCIMPPVLEMF